MKVNGNSTYVIPRTADAHFGSGESMFGKGVGEREMAELALKFSSPKTERDYRNRALFLVMSRTGLRAKEIVGLTFSNMVRTPEGEAVFCYEKKGGKIGYTMPGEEALQAVREYHEFTGVRSDYFFFSLPNRSMGGQRTPITTTSLRRIVQTWDVRTGRGRLIHPHALRHSVGQRVMDAAGSIAAQKVLGHSSPVTTARFYTRPVYDGLRYLQW